MDNTVLSYQCPACGSPIQYVPGASMRCAHCGNEYDIEVLKKLSSIDNLEGKFDWGDYKKKFQQNVEKLDDLKEYVCNFCGALIETDSTIAATHCPYCDNEIVLNDRLSGGIKPDFVIPFKIDKKAAISAIQDYFKGKKLLPKHFRDEQELGKVKGVYVPCWLFDATMDGQIALQGSISSGYSDSSYRYTKTDHYLIEVDGSMAFHRVPVDASEKMDNDLMDAVEPFDYNELIPFETAYLSGFLADRFDADPDASLPRADERMQMSALDLLKKNYSGKFNNVTLKKNMMKLKNPSVKYALLPVYLVNMEYDGKTYRFAVNGQTGKVTGELPISKSRKRMYFWRRLLLVGLIIAVILFFLLR